MVQTTEAGAWQQRQVQLKRRLEQSRGDQEARHQGTWYQRVDGVTTSALKDGLGISARFYGPHSRISPSLARLDHRFVRFHATDTNCLFQFIKETETSHYLGMYQRGSPLPCRKLTWEKVIGETNSSPSHRLAKYYQTEYYGRWRVSTRQAVT